MASKKRNVAELNNTVSKYLEQLGMREEAKEFESRARALTIDLDGFRSIWFQRMTTRLSPILHEIGQQRPEIDLNQPAPEDMKVVVAVEDEGSRTDTHRKRKRVISQHNSGCGAKLITSTALRIHEREAHHVVASTAGITNPNKVLPFDKHKNKVTLIDLVSGSDTESD